MSFDELSHLSEDIDFRPRLANGGFRTFFVPLIECHFVVPAVFLPLYVFYGFGSGFRLIKLNLFRFTKRNRNSRRKYTFGCPKKVFCCVEPNYV